MRKLVAIALVTIALPVLAQTSSLQIHGYLTGSLIRVDSIRSWTERDYGKFDVGSDASGDSSFRETAQAQVGIDWTPTKWLLVHADGLARREPSGTIGSKAGLIQGYLDLYNEHWRLRAGSFWLPTSRENIDPLWTSPYTISYSALNSWIGQEVRPVGADLQWSPDFYVTAGATVFRGNDTMGTELAARGWTLGNRLTVYNEALPQPFTDETTKPIESDLDHRNGYSGRLRLQLPERALIQFAHIENRSELVPEIDGQTPWRTRFDVVSASAGASGPTTVAAEYARGATTVAFPGGTFQMNFATVYLLLSHKQGADRFSARVERFTTNGAVYDPGDDTRERGHAVTVAWLHDSGPHLRYGLELARVSAHRTDSTPGGSAATAQIRYGF